MSVAYIHEHRAIDVIVGRQEAGKADDKYFLGSVCGRGHHAMTTKARLDYTFRKTKTGECVTCSKLSNVNKKMDQKLLEVKKRKDKIMFEREMAELNKMQIG